MLRKGVTELAKKTKKRKRQSLKRAEMKNRLYLAMVLGAPATVKAISDLIRAIGELNK